MFTYKYFRNETVAQRWRNHGVLDKPAGWVTGKCRYEKHSEAQKLCDHLSAQGITAEVVTAGRGGR